MQLLPGVAILPPAFGRGNTLRREVGRVSGSPPKHNRPVAHATSVRPRTPVPRENLIEAQLGVQIDGVAGTPYDPARTDRHRETGYECQATR